MLNTQNYHVLCNIDLARNNLNQINTAFAIALNHELETDELQGLLSMAWDSLAHAQNDLDNAYQLLEGNQ